MEVPNQNLTPREMAESEYHRSKLRASEHFHNRFVVHFGKIRGRAMGRTLYRGGTRRLRVVVARSWKFDFLCLPVNKLPYSVVRGRRACPPASGRDVVGRVTRRRRRDDSLFLEMSPDCRNQLSSLRKCPTDILFCDAGLQNEGVSIDKVESADGL